LYISGNLLASDASPMAPRPASLAALRAPPLAAAAPGMAPVAASIVFAGSPSSA
jgi:hypothetical protein